MKVMLAEEMRNADKLAVEEYCMQGIALMENAGRALYERAKARLDEAGASLVVVAAGKGNNGGDGFVCARMLKNNGYDVKIVFAGGVWETRGDARVNLEILRKLGVQFLFEPAEIKAAFAECGLIIDAVFGTGIKDYIDEPYFGIIESINSSGKYVISADIPSGVNANSGEEMGIAVAADETVTFAAPKLGLLLYPGFLHAGKISVAEISIPRELLTDEKLKHECLTAEEAARLMPQRKKRGNKGSYGRLIAIAGSRGMAGAAAICCKSAYRAGAGLVYAAIAETSFSVMQSLVPEAVALPLRDDGGLVYRDSIRDIENRLDMADTVILGPGLGGGGGVRAFVSELMERLKVPALIDADGLNAIAEDMEILKKSNQPHVLTPHPGEMSRMTGKPVQEILDDTVGTARGFAEEYGCVVLLKDSRTVIAAPDGRVCINVRGSSALSKAGSGDVLSGTTGALMAQGLDGYEAASLGAYIHGLAGELAGERLTPYGLLAGELADYTAEAIKELIKC